MEIKMDKRCETIKAARKCAKGDEEKYTRCAVKILAHKIKNLLKKWLRQDKKREQENKGNKNES